MHWYFGAGIEKHGPVSPPVPDRVELYFPSENPIYKHMFELVRLGLSSEIAQLKGKWEVDTITQNRLAMA